MLLAAALFVIVSLSTDAVWVHTVFLAIQGHRIELDTNYDGRPDYVEFWEEGEIVRSEWDLNFDGIPDYRNVFEGGILKVLELDADFDGHFEYREVYTDDTITALQDADKDGRYEPVETTITAGEPAGTQK